MRFLLIHNSWKIEIWFFFQSLNHVDTIWTRGFKSRAVIILYLVPLPPYYIGKDIFNALICNHRNSFYIHICAFWAQIGLKRGNKMVPLLLLLTLPLSNGLRVGHFSKMKLSCREDHVNLLQNHSGIEMWIGIFNPLHTTYSWNIKWQKCAGISWLWVLNEIIQKKYPENMKKNRGTR